jgi:hypothetical protein
VRRQVAGAVRAAEGGVEQQEQAVVLARAASRASAKDVKTSTCSPGVFTSPVRASKPHVQFTQSPVHAVFQPQPDLANSRLRKRCVGQLQPASPRSPRCRPRLDSPAAAARAFSSKREYPNAAPMQQQPHHALAQASRSSTACHVNANDEGGGGGGRPGRQPR